MLLLFVAPQPAIAQPGYINTALVVEDLWAPLNARGPQDAIFWTAAELYQWIDEAKARFARKHGAFVVYDQSLATAAADADYDLPAGHILTIQADVAGKVLRARNVQEMEALDAAWPVATAAEPKAFLQDTKGVTQITLAPAPSVPYASLAIGLAMAELPAAITQANAILAAPPALREYFTFYALAEARAKESQASMDEVAEWLRSIISLIDQVAEGLWA